MTKISIDAIFYSPVASGGMVPLEKATLIKGVGLEGDRYANRVGTYSVLKSSIHRPGEQEPGRQLTLISGEGAQAALKENAIEWSKSMGDLRRNVVLKGISSQELFRTIGSILQLGDSEARVFVHRDCVPCMYNEKRNCTPGLMEALWESGGVSCEVIEGGTIVKGDVGTMHPNDEGLVVDTGHRDSGFFTRPSKRSAAMVREALEEKKVLHKKMVFEDPEGVIRAQSSYEAVGLSFWPRSTAT